MEKEQARLNINHLISLVDQTFECDPKNYWKLKHLPQEEWNVEIISHSSRHLSKSAGVLAGICESYEHDSNFNKEDAMEVVYSSFATILKLSATLDMDSDQLLAGLMKKLKK